MSAPALLHAAFNKNHEGFSKWPGLETQPKVIYRMLPGKITEQSEYLFLHKVSVSHPQHLEAAVALTNLKVLVGIAPAQ